jgi:hypothetical protein
MIKILIANKVDMEEDRKISTERGQELANIYNMEYLETSAFSGRGVPEMFLGTTTQMV